MHDNRPQGHISICIPTYHRPLLLKQALESCLAQSYENIEIVVGDDSKNNESAEVVAAMMARFPGKIDFARNMPSLGQAENVNSLFRRAKGDRIVLLHDDDLLLPNALTDLSACWDHTPELSAAFGRQYEMSMDGKLLMKESEIANRAFGRVLEKAGLLKNPIDAGIQNMFPNNGYMVLTSLARDVGYRRSTEIGDACDYDFGLRLCQKANKLWFIENYVSTYRLTDVAISKTSITSPYVYQALLRLKPTLDDSSVFNATMKRIAPSATSGFARRGDGKQALKILLSNNYPWQQRLSLKFLFHCILTSAALVKGSDGVTIVLRLFKGFVRQ